MSIIGQTPKHAAAALAVRAARRVMDYRTRAKTQTGRNRKFWLRAAARAEHEVLAHAGYCIR